MQDLNVLQKMIADAEAKPTFQQPGAYREICKEFFLRICHQEYRLLAIEAYLEAGDDDDDAETGTRSDGNQAEETAAT